MATTEIGSEFLTTIRISFSQMIEIAGALNKGNDYADAPVIATTQQEIINNIINDAKSVLSQMDGFV